MNKKILVTGAGGYIGSCLIGAALKSGYKVKAVDKFYFGKDKLKSFFSNSDVEIIELDIRELDIDHVKDCCAVIDLAGLSNDPSAELNESLTWSINYYGALNLAVVAKRANIKRFIYMSSCSVYGASENICTEKAKENPLTAYAKIKLQVEKQILKMSDDDFCVTALRNSTTFGSSLRMRFDLVVNIMVLQAIKNNQIIIKGNGKQKRPLIHVKDIADICIKLLEEETGKIQSQKYNIGYANYTIHEIAATIQRTLLSKNHKNKIEVVFDASPNDFRNYEVSFERFKNNFSFFPKRSIVAGIEEVYDDITTKKITVDETCFTLDYYKKILGNYESAILFT